MWQITKATIGIYIYLGVSPIAYNGPYFWVDRHGIGLSEVFQEESIWQVKNLALCPMLSVMQLAIKKPYSMRPPQHICKWGMHSALKQIRWLSKSLKSKSNEGFVGFPLLYHYQQMRAFSRMFLLLFSLTPLNTIIKIKWGGGGSS